MVIAHETEINKMNEFFTTFTLKYLFQLKIQFIESNKVPCHSFLPARAFFNCQPRSNRQGQLILLCFEGLMVFRSLVTEIKYRTREKVRKVSGWAK